jgi:serine protease Do
MKKRFPGRMAGLVMAISLGLAAPLPAQAFWADKPSTPTSAYGLPDFSPLVEEVGPAVVNISVTQQVSRSGGGPLGQDPFYDFLRRFGFPIPGMPFQGPGGGPAEPPAQITRGVGSGFIVSPDGYVLTNAHVIDSAHEVLVRLTDKREFKAQVIGSDSRTDVALLKIDAQGLPAVRIGNADASRVGEWVIAMGSPFGFENTVTAGIISAKARRLPDENYVPFIQTDVAINPGNSGGPLFNLKGEVIGINSQIYSRSGGFMGISFAIPIDVAMQVKDQIREHGRVQRGRLGVTIQGVDRELAHSFGMSETKGALISEVEPSSPAALAGLRPGDVVLAVNGVEIVDSADLPRLIGEKRPGTRVKLAYWRDGKRHETQAVLTEVEATASAPTPGSRSASAEIALLGIQARALSTQEARQIGVEGGVLVEETGASANRTGLRSGDVILAVNNQPVGQVDALRALLERAGARFALLVQRGNARIFLPMRREALGE